MMDDREIEFAERAVKTLVIDAICGVGFPSTLLAEECVRAGLAAGFENREVAYGCGNAYEYVWRRERLQRCSIDQLQELYEGLCEAREETNPSPIDEACTSSGLILQ